MPKIVIDRLQRAGEKGRRGTSRDRIAHVWSARWEEDGSARLGSASFCSRLSRERERERRVNVCKKVHRQWRDARYTLHALAWVSNRVVQLLLTGIRQRQAVWPRLERTTSPSPPSWHPVCVHAWTEITIVSLSRKSKSSLDVRKTFRFEFLNSSYSRTGSESKKMEFWEIRGLLLSAFWNRWNEKIRALRPSGHFNLYSRNTVKIDTLKYTHLHFCFLSKGK